MMVQAVRRSWFGAHELRSVGLRWVAFGGCALLAAACQKKPEQPPAPPVAAAPPKPQEHLPMRQPGLWETVVTEEGSEDAPQKLQICIDPITDVHLGVLGTDLSASKCSRTVNHLPDGTWGVLAECQVGPGVKTEYSGSISGDYTQDYGMRLRAQTTGSSLPQMSRVTTYVVASKRIGVCGATQRPGDVVDVGNEGVKFNLFDMSGVEPPVSAAAKGQPEPAPGDGDE
jgi:hypothetical protein